MDEIPELFGAGGEPLRFVENEKRLARQKRCQGNERLAVFERAQNQQILLRGRKRHPAARVLLQRTLRRGIKTTDRLDHVAEQIEAKRQVAVEREDVHDAAADGKLAARLDDGNADVAGVVEARRQLFDLNRLVHANRRRVFVQDLERDGFSESRFQRGQNNAWGGVGFARGRAGKVSVGLDLFGQDFQRGFVKFVGQVFVFCKMKNVGEAKEFEVVVQLLGTLGVRCDQADGLVDLADESSEKEGESGAGKSRDT